MKTKANQKFTTLFFVLFTFINLSFGLPIALGDSPIQQGNSSLQADKNRQNSDAETLLDALKKITKGRQTFRYDTFGDEAFWGDGLKLHMAIAGEKLGGVGPGLSPNSALGLGLKVDIMHCPKV